MGILDKVVLGVAKVATQNVRYEALEKATEVSEKVADAVHEVNKDLEKKADKKYFAYKEKLLSKNPDNCHLIMTKKRVDKGGWDTDFRSVFHIADMNDKIKYQAIGSNENFLQRIVLFDSDSNNVGEVIEQPFAIRNPLFKESNPADYTIKIGGQKVGEIKTTRGKFFEINERVNLDFVDWNVQRSVGGDITITDHEENTVGEITEGHFGGITGFDFSNPKDEVLMILIELVYRANSISQERKRRRKR